MLDRMSRAGVGLAMLALVSCAGTPEASTAPELIDRDGAYHFLVTDVASGWHHDVFELRPADLGLSGDWSIRKDTLRGGKQDGVDRVTIDTGNLQIVVLPTRGMSVYEVRCGDLRLGWDSPSREIVHPSLVDLEGRGGLGWLEGFNEFMVRCGLEFAGHPGTDVMIDNVGNESTMELSLHGRIGNLPAGRVEVVIEKAAPHRITLRGTVDERQFYGPRLRLETELSVVPGEKTWRVEDTVTNLGDSTQEFQVIYHTNFGAPILEEGAEAFFPARTLQPMNDKAAGAVDGHAIYAAPTPGFVEEVFLVEPFADADDRTAAVLRNANGDRGAMLEWSVDQLPYFTQWKNTAARGDGYVTGLEPGTGFPFNRRIERAAGRVPQLSAGESRRFRLDFSALDSKPAVEGAMARVEQIRAGRPTEVLADPPTTD